MQHETPLAVAEAWQAAANAQDRAALLALSSPEIEIVGPRGSARGHTVLVEWLARAGLQLTTRQRYAQGDAVVLAQHGVWHAAETGAIVGERDVATYFRLVDGKVAYLARYDTLDEALAAAGIDTKPRE